MATISSMSESSGEMMTVNEIAQLLRVHPTSVRRWQKSGTLKGYRIGPKGSLRFTKETVLRFINNSAEFSIHKPTSL